MYIVVIWLSIVIALIGCGEPSGIRHYTEVVVESESADPHAGLNMGATDLPMQQQTQDPVVQEMLAASRADVPIQWQTPSNWMEEPGDTMRLATFKNKGAPAVTCTIVSLGGMAGGIESNVARWMRQINVSVEESVFRSFVEKIPTIETEGGLPVKLIDLTQLQETHTDQKDSMMAALLQLDNATVFIKMTGSIQAVLDNKDEMLKLIKSIKLTNE